MLTANWQGHIACGDAIFSQDKIYFHGLVDCVYAPFAQVPADRTFSPEILGVKDSLVKQLRNAAFKVGKGEITVDDAISMFGTF